MAIALRIQLGAESHEEFSNVCAKHLGYAGGHALSGFGAFAMILHFIQGSPFARMARVLLREFDIECVEEEIREFPPPASFFDINPLGQVPVLEDRGKRFFPTHVVLARILDVASETRSTGGVSSKLARDAFHRDDEQLLAVLLAMSDMLATAKYQIWAGLDAVQKNSLGFNPAERNIERVYRTLDWLETRATDGGFWPDAISIQDVVLTCIILWSEARGAIAWRGRPRLETIVERLARRPSFAATAPLPWSPDDKP
jgi:glutathione S-transferase